MCAVAAMDIPLGVTGGLPALFDMVKNPHRTETCAHCDPNHVLGHQCCGLCYFEDVCTDAQTAFLLAKLGAMNIDLSGFTPDIFFEAIKGRSVWLVGDSQTRNFYGSLECFMADYTITVERSLPFPGQDALNTMMRRGLDFNIVR